MAVAFRAATNLVATNATSAVQNKPTGTVDNDILVALLYVEGGKTVTAPSGWTQFATFHQATDNYDMTLWWKRAASEGTSWTWSWSAPSVWRDAWVVALSGAVTSGSPLDGTSTSNSGTGTAAACNSITLAETDSLILTCGSWFNSNTATAPTGTPTFTERVDTGNNVYCATASATASGAVGSKTITIAGSTDWSTFMVGVRSQVTAGGAALPAPGIRKLQAVNRVAVR